jgi:hypothetical protein
MAELTVTLVVVGMLALKAAVFVALVVIGVRLANGTPILPHRDEWASRMKTSFLKLRRTVARARHHSGAGFQVQLHSEMQPRKLEGPESL